MLINCEATVAHVGLSIIMSEMKSPTARAHFICNDPNYHVYSYDIKSSHMVPNIYCIDASLGRMPPYALRHAVIDVRNESYHEDVLFKNQKYLIILTSIILSYASQTINSMDKM